MVVDGSLMKHMLNPVENVILLESSTFAGTSQLDTYLMDTLLPWIMQFHVNQGQGIQTLWNQNKIGRMMMCEDLFDLDYKELMKAIDGEFKISSIFVSK
jgi:hypothetical protein